MFECNRACKHYMLGYCVKYNEFARLTRRRGFTPGFLLHPLHYFADYYREECTTGIGHLMEIASRCLTDDVSKSICEQYKKRGSITFRQRKYLVYNILNCYEMKSGF